MTDLDLLVPDHSASNIDIIAFGDFCEGVLLDERGKLDVDKLGMISRKTLCQFLGIGDSTITGWLQAERMPRAAAIAYVLYWNLKHRIAEIERLKRQRTDPLVVKGWKAEGEYAIAGFRERDGEVECIKLADAVDFGWAQYATRVCSANYRERQESAMALLSQATDPDNPEITESLIESMEDDLLMAANYAEWQKKQRERNELPPV